MDERRSNYLAEQREKLTGKDSATQFYKNVRNYQSSEKPEQYNVLDLYPGLTDGEAAEELAGYFNRISREFEPLDMADIPVTHDRVLPTLEPYQVSGRLRSFKKPSSRV